MLLHFCSDFFGSSGKRLVKKAKVNFKIYDVTNWNTSNYSKHIARYLKMLSQSDNDIWLVNRILRGKYFPSKTMQKMSQGD